LQPIYKKCIEHRKSSTGLLQIKHIEKCMIRVEDIAGALELRKEINSRECSEAADHQENLDQEYTASKIQFEKRQGSQLAFFEFRNENRKAEKVRDADRTIRVAEASLNVAKNHESMISREPKTSNSTQPVSYGVSFEHVARENRFEIEPSLSGIRPPKDIRGRKRPATKIRPVIQNIPRLYVFQNESALLNEKPFFATSLVRGRSEDEPGKFSSESWAMDSHGDEDGVQMDYAVSKEGIGLVRLNSDDDGSMKKLMKGEIPTERQGDELPVERKLVEGEVETRADESTNEKQIKESPAETNTEEPQIEAQSS
jgi:hypothetical protein